MNNLLANETAASLRAFFQAAKPKLPKTPMAAEDIAAFCEKLDVLSDVELTVEQKTAINLELVKLRGVAYQKMKLFKV